jgi:hypothetical protein
MTNYASNSHRDREKDAEGRNEVAERPKLEKIITGTVLQKKKGLGSKIAETFSGDNLQNVGAFVFFEVAMPRIKDLVSDALTQGVQRAIYGDGGTQFQPRDTTRRTSYNGFSGGSTPSATAASRQFSQRARETHNFDEIVLATQAEAYQVLDALEKLVMEYGTATVADLYDLVDITGTFQDDKWGWTNLRGSRPIHQRQGYLLSLPQPIELD